MTTWKDDIGDVIDEAVGVFGGAFTISRKVVGAFNAATGVREGDSYSQEIDLIESRKDQELAREYGTEAVAYRGLAGDLTEAMGPEPQLAEGMYVTDADGVRRRVVKVHTEGVRKGFVLVCVMDRTAAE